MDELILLLYDTMISISITEIEFFVWKKKKKNEYSQCSDEDYTNNYSIDTNPVSETEQTHKHILK